MSGPKSSRYTLTPEQRRILAEQRKLERRKAVAKEKIKLKNKKLLQIGGSFDTEKKVSEELLKRTGSDGGFSKKLAELDKLVAAADNIIKNTPKDDADSLEKTAKTISEYAEKAEKLSKELSACAAENDSALQKKLGEAIDKGFASSFTEEKQFSHFDTALEKGKSALAEKILKTLNSSPLSPQLNKELQKALDGLNTVHTEEYLKNYSALTVSPLLKRCKAYADEYESCREEFEALYTEYTAVCGLYRYKAQTFSCTSESVKLLKEEIRRIKESVAENDEQAYISDCIEEVMEEMGYNVLGTREVTKKNGKRFRNELYTYEEGTALNVTYSSDGKIVMELGGTDDTDRLPDAEETALLCGSMTRFCSDFKEIEKRLLAKGVILAERLSMLPPTEEYAQIINTSDYDMTGRTDKLQTQKKRKKTSKRKAMRKE